MNDSATADSVRRTAPVQYSRFDILAGHRATLNCQFVAFAEYVVAAEEHEIGSVRSNQWTKAATEIPAAQEEYLKSVSLYVGRPRGLWQGDCLRAGSGLATARHERAHHANIQIRYQSRQQSPAAESSSRCTPPRLSAISDPPSTFELDGSTPDQAYFNSLPLRAAAKNDKTLRMLRSDPR